MNSRWLSTRALTLHAACLLWVCGCVAAGYWQISRALDGNSLSYVYVVEWPIFAIAGIFGWWALLHAPEVTDEERAERKAHEDEQRKIAQQAKRRPEEEDATLAAYNDHLEQLNQVSKSRKEETTAEERWN